MSYQLDTETTGTGNLQRDWIALYTVYIHTQVWRGKNRKKRKEDAGTCGRHRERERERLDIHRSWRRSEGLRCVAERERGRGRFLDRGWEDESFTFPGAETGKVLSQLPACGS